MTVLFESALQLYACVAATIATLQAGTKALRAVSHDERGVMDGPLILSPFDVKELERNNEEGDVSPLWEITFGFSEAVRLLRDASQENDDIRSQFGVEKTTLTEQREEAGYYSMASPHLPYVKGDLERDDDDEEEVPLDSIHNNTKTNEENISTNNESSLNESPMQSLVVSTPYTTMVFPRSHRIMKKRKSPYSFLIKCINKISSQIKLLISVCHDDPMEQLESVRRIYSNINPATSDDEDIIDTSSDYDTVHSSRVSIPKDFESNFDGTNTTKIAHIKVFAPNMFQKLRSRFGVKEEDFIKSILESGPYVSFQSNSKGAARAGGFFFFTRDGAYMVKTIKKAEVKAVLDMLPKYNNFMKQNAKRSLLTRFFGLYSVQVDDISTGRVSEGEECVFLIMNSVFPAEGSKFITERFDLKGSTVGRECSLEERKERGNQAVLKDLDLEREVNVIKTLPTSFGLSDYGISIGSQAKLALLSQLRKDLKLLVSCSVMDYSMLVGVVNLDSAEFQTKGIATKNHQIEKELLKQLSTRRKRIISLLRLFSAPMRLISLPLEILANIICKCFISTLVLPFPYYSQSFCGVYGGTLSMLPGKRLGNRALYYMGVIDFLQPWTTQKVLEKELKGLMGYEKSEISCANPKDYAQRFLVFMDKHIT